MKYRTPQKIAEIKSLYAMGRTPQMEDSYSKGRFTLRQISERVDVPVQSVYYIARGRKQ